MRTAMAFVAVGLAVSTTVGAAEKVRIFLTESQSTQVSGQAATPKGIATVPFVVNVGLDDNELAARLPAGATGTAAVFTDHVKVSHIIRRVLLRQIAILNYVIPF